jgi:hypothetical protein
LVKIIYLSRHGRAVTQALKKLRQEGDEFKASLGYTVRHCLNETNQNKTNKSKTLHIKLENILSFNLYKIATNLCAQ